MGFSSFSVHDCKCFCESDRPLVYNNIANLMKASCIIEESASEQTALASFDVLVRDEFSEKFFASLGQYALQYKHYVAAGAAASAGVMLDINAGIAHGMPYREALTWI